MVTRRPRNGLRFRRVRSGWTSYQGTLYLEDGLHRAVRTALHQRTAIHARVLVIDG
jgi:hypothetical protein